MRAALKNTVTAGAFGLALLAAGSAQAATYGCFEVVGTSGINIRATPFSSAAVIGTAGKGEILKKWKRFCALRGFWCPVEKANGLQGHADKSFLKKVPCPNE